MGVLLLVRHGQASFGAADYDVLSDLGVEQARTTGVALGGAGVTPSLIVHGSMRRQRDTAGAMAAAAGWQAPSEVDVRWDEFDHLDVVAQHAAGTGNPTRDLSRRAFQDLFEQATARWTAGSDVPGSSDDDGYGESFAGFVARVDAGLRQVAGSVGSGETAVVVTSGGVIAAVCGLLMLPPGQPDDPAAAGIASAWHRLNAVMVNASVTRVVVGASGPRLLTFNEHSHLDRAQVTYR